MLINRNMLEWFLLIACKEHTSLRSTNLFSKNHPTLRFWLLREGREMPNTERITLTKFRNIHRKTPVLESPLQLC